MENLKKLFVAMSLTVFLGGTALAGEMNAPPCPDPGEMNAPPCTSTQSDDPASQTATISSEVEAVTIATVISALEDMLTVY